MKHVTTAIIVTHNNEKHIEKCVDCLQKQTTPPDRIVIVDSGSKDSSYLFPWAEAEGFEVYLSLDNIGFCVANNVGLQFLHPQTETIALINPDAYLTPDFLEKANSYLHSPDSSDVGLVSGPLQGYDIDHDQPTGQYDSTGIYSTWYGRWYDRDQGKEVGETVYDQVEEPEALCGAVMIIKKQAADDVLIDGEELLDSSFFMYKDDVDLSLRLRDKGWRLAFLPTIKAYHCRGWQQDRKQVSRHFRLCSAVNDLKIYWRRRSPKVIFALVKYLAVKLFNY